MVEVLRKKTKDYHPPKQQRGHYLKKVANAYRYASQQLNYRGYYSPEIRYVNDLLAFIRENSVYRCFEDIPPEEKKKPLNKLSQIGIVYKQARSQGFAGPYKRNAMFLDELHAFIEKKSRT